MAEKLDMRTTGMTEVGKRRIQELFPNCVTEVIKNGKTTVAVDFEALKQELADTVTEEKQERYQMSWPDKTNAKKLSSSAVSDTLRPDRETSKSFDTTKNLYIEGDNLIALKLLQETYLGKIKVIYIDPPYNTGNDFVYSDDFSQAADDYIANSGQLDQQGNRLVKNLDSNGRYHTDWLNMIY